MGNVLTEGMGKVLDIYKNWWLIFETSSGVVHKRDSSVILS